MGSPDPSAVLRSKLDNGSFRLDRNTFVRSAVLALSLVLLGDRRTQSRQEDLAYSCLCTLA